MLPEGLKDFKVLKTLKGIANPINDKPSAYPNLVPSNLGMEF